jgi:hypothetical protein
LVAQGEVVGPSVPGVYQLFGGWNHACSLAGVECGESRRSGYETRWTDREILEYLAEYLHYPGGRGTFGGYDDWRQTYRPDAPSAGTVRMRLGPWSEAKRSALRAGSVELDGADGDAQP